MSDRVYTGLADSDLGGIPCFFFESVDECVHMPKARFLGVVDGGERTEVKFLFAGGPDQERDFITTQFRVTYEAWEIYLSPEEEGEEGSSEIPSGADQN